ncbi:tetratricopeptide repeat protein [Clostridium sp. SHJSY1]|uniref:tetratricopeptide repeat protein n=1 Tax=Clostridium sp. SHJSY1 TaxID=2942483 RepID=UPI00287671FC|nr:tetratricopeptide repeat protein [Clostridium sp. SHJSY1]MDS0524363.1 tetratricopeptide repeat protein [Clostridium sp. SHJSY1]
MELLKSLRAAELNEEGLKLIDNGNYEEAIKCFEKAKEIDPRNMDSYINLGIAYASQESFDKAYEEFQGWFNTRDEKVLYSIV